MSEKFTPLDPRTWKRLDLQAEPFEFPRGQVKDFTVRLTDGRNIVARSQACSMPRCICDAVLVSIDGQPV